jgi:uroporphyrinogen decarboxylase
MTKGLKDEDFEGPHYIIKRTGGKRAIFLLLSDPFKLSWKLRGGMENLLFDYALDPELVHKLASITTDFNLAALEYASNMGIDAIAVEGDLAGSKNLIMSPDHFKEYVKPYLERIVEYSHKLGLKIIKHSDGNIWQILDDLVEVGFDGIHPIQPQCMDIGEVKEHLNDKACIVGNIDCQELLPNGSTEEVDRIVKETVEIASPGGGYIISSSNSIHPGVRPENYIAMVEAVHKYGHYKNNDK